MGGCAATIPDTIISDVMENNADKVYALGIKSFM